jgi:hypothetical protein
MGVSTDGQICYGIKFDEDVEFPWRTDEWDYDMETWWIEGVLGFKYSFEIFDEKGNYKDGKEPPQEIISAYFQERRDFERTADVLPVSMVNYCSGEYPEYILAVPRTCMSASRGYPQEFNPNELIVSEEEKQSLIEFCKRFDIEIPDEPRWWLSSYWG